MRNRTGRRLALSIAAAVLCASLVVWLAPLIGDAGIDEIPISRVIADVETGRVESIESVQGDPEILVRYSGGSEVRSALPGGGGNVMTALQDAGLDLASPNSPEVSVAARTSWGEVVPAMAFASVLILGMLLPIGVIALGVALGIRLAGR